MIRRYYIIFNISDNSKEIINTSYIEKKYKVDNGQIKDYQVLDIVCSEDNVVDIELYELCEKVFNDCTNLLFDFIK